MADEVVTPVKAKRDYLFAVGRRKEAVARVRLYKTVSATLSYGNITLKKGDMVVNEKDIKEYFKSDTFKAIYEQPLKITNSLNKFAWTISVRGGGQRSQLGAVVLGIARALSLLDPSNRVLLRKESLLTRDPRIRERRKVGMGGKARARKQSPKR